MLALILIFKYTKLCVNFNRISKYLYNYLNIITSARYGNLHAKVEEGVDALTIMLSKNTNALLESINDRDKVIQEYIEKEKQSQNIKQDFISSLAHDLKVPIIAQDNTYDLFLQGNFGPISPTQRQAIENLKISNNDLKNLVCDLLDIYKLDKKELELNKSDTNLNELIKEVIAQNKSIITIRNKEIFFDDKEKINALIDSFLIKRVLNNLIANAIFYGKDSKNIFIALKNEDNKIKISITDEGDGIIEQDINNIFKKYYSASKKYSNIGVGLGLYFANKIVLAHQGTIEAKNNPEKGATFTIELPKQN